MKTFLDGRVTLWGGDCLDVVRGLADNSIDSVCTDPPYALVSITKRFGAETPDYSGRSNMESNADAQPPNRGAQYKRLSRGFMGKAWDTGETAFAVEFWAEILRVLKPGGHVAAFGGTRSYHRLACAIEDAGFEIRDQLAWTYGSGFPKSHNVSRNLDNDRCRCEEVSERSVRPLLSSDVSTPVNDGEEQRKILHNGMSKQGSPDNMDSGSKSASYSTPYGTDESIVEGWSDVPQSQGQLREREIRSLSARVGGDVEDGRLRDGASLSDGEVGRTSADANGVRASQGSLAVEQSEIELGALAGQPQPQKRGAWNHCERCGKPVIPDGLGSALKPAWEPICLARKPLSEKNLAANCLRWGTGAINVDGCRVESQAKSFTDNREAKHNDVYGKFNPSDYDGSKGRFPANLCHDGSDEVLAAFPSPHGAGSAQPKQERWNPGKTEGWGNIGTGPCGARIGDSGSAARFFYSSKASKADRVLSKHPTVKPVKLMQWLVRLITPPGGTTLDPFSGTGTTGEAAWREGFSAVLIEREEEYQADIERRMLFAKARPKAGPAARAASEPETLPLPLESEAAYQATMAAE